MYKYRRMHFSSIPLLSCKSWNFIQDVAAETTVCEEKNKAPWVIFEYRSLFTKKFFFDPCSIKLPFFRSWRCIGNYIPFGGKERSTCIFIHGEILVVVRYRTNISERIVLGFLVYYINYHFSSQGVIVEITLRTRGKNKTLHLQRDSSNRKILYKYF